MGYNNGNQKLCNVASKPFVKKIILCTFSTQQNNLDDWKGFRLVIIQMIINTKDCTCYETEDASSKCNSDLIYKTIRK